MKIAIICPSKDMTCGIGDYSHSLANALNGKADIFYTNEVSEKLIAFKPDIVNFQWEYALYDTKRVVADLNILRKKGIQTNVTLHGFSDYDTKNRILESDLFDGYIVLNEGFRQHLMARGIKKPVNVIPLGIQGYEFSKNDSGFVRDILGIRPDELVIGSFGFMGLHKNFHTIIEALARSNTIFLLCSYNKEVNSEYVLELQQTANRLGVKYVHLSGYMDIDSVVKVLHACDAIVFPYVDVFTYSSSAAIRTGISSLSPVIASDITFFDDVPDYSKGGPVYKVQNGLVDAINKVLHEELIRQSIIENAQAFVKMNGWENIAEQYLRVLQQYRKI